ncbi:MAG: response regulator [Nitrospira sp.]|nr:MAG: response regulator [Nitrospira sp.]
MPKILVADDSIAVRKVAERLLTEAGLGVALAANGEEALAYLAKERPDVVVSDVIMPDKQPLLGKDGIGGALCKTSSLRGCNRLNRDREAHEADNGFSKFMLPLMSYSNHPLPNAIVPWLRRSR